MNFALSIAALMLGPVIYAASHRGTMVRRALDAAILLTIVVIIGVHVVPEAFEHAGVWSIVVLLLGLAFPVLLERLFRKATDTAHRVIVAIAAVGLLIHAVVDGMALLPQNGNGLAYAIILHRLPVGMALWWAIQPNFGKTAAAIAFVLVGIATAAGYFVGESVIAVAETRSLAMLQAFVAGSLIHVVTFGVKHKHD